MAAPGRYKSRLLNYLVERSQKLSDQAGQRLRQARVGMVWGVQLLLYPLYAAFQTSRLVGRRLSQGGAMPGQARLKPPQADETVNAVIQLARTLADEGAITVRPEVGSLNSRAKKSSAGETVGSGDPTGLEAGRELGMLEPASPECISLAPAQLEPASPSLAIAARPNSSLNSDSSEPVNRNINLNSRVGGVDIRGVASELSDRALVLVDNSNRILPLEAEQQWTLQQTIVQQIADYNYRRQRYSQQLALVEASEGGGLSDRPLPLPQPRAQQLSGFRWLTHVMGWMQTSRLAQTANLFQESQLAVQVAPPPFLYWDPEPGQQLTRQTLAQLDAPLAGLEQRYLQSEIQDKAPEHKPDIATQALRFTAKLFGLEEAAARWLGDIDPPAPSSTAPNRSNFDSRLAASPSDKSGLGAIATPTTDPWEAQLAQQQSSRVFGLSAPSASPLPAKPKPAGAETKQGIEPPAERSPRGWQRLTTRFGGLLKALRQPAGPITPLSSPNIQASQPSPAAPTNANLGLLNDVGQSANSEPSSFEAHHSSLSSRLLSEIAGRSRLTNTTQNEAKLKNVTSNSQRQKRSSPRAPLGSTVDKRAGIPASSDLGQTTETAATYESPYIETTARFSGYERHPLEIVLSRLDQILLWIEEQGLKLWQWLTTPRQQ